MAKVASDRASAQLVKLYADAELALKAQVQEALLSGQLGTARYRQAQLARVTSILAELQAAAIPEATEIAAASYALGMRSVEASMGFTPGNFAGVHQEAVSALADNLAGKLNAAAQTVGRRVEDVFRQEGLKAAAQGLLRGSTRRAASAELASALTKEGVTGFVARNGARWGLEPYAKMAIRTTTREAVSYGTANRMAEAGLDLVTISQHEDSDEVCDEYAGNTYSLSGASDEYPLLEEFPPFHPNCVHVMGPAEVDLDQMEAAIANAQSFDELKAAVSVG
jgi:hypothetical protein